jgi:putative DNA primase/helicase
LQYVQPGLVGLMDGSVSTLAPVECDLAAGDDCDTASDHVFGDQVLLSDGDHDDLCLIDERGATSVIGIGSERNLPNWNATSAAFLETARTFNDLLLAVNEVALLAGKKGDAYGPIRERIYTFSEGSDRARMSSSTLSSFGSSQWRGIFVSTAENSFNAYAAFSGETRNEGEYARCLDVVATVKGKPTIFDHIPKGMDNRQARRWARNQLVKLRRAGELQHGTALRPYLEFLVAQGTTLRTKIRAYEKAFMKRAKRLKLDGALAHAAKNFAVIFAGGSLAIEAGVLPWPEDVLLDAIVTCFESAIVRGHANALAIARRTLQKKLASDEIIERTPNAIFGPMDHAGFSEHVNGKVRITVASAAFAKWFENRAQRLAALHWLHDQGHLDMGTKRASPSLRTTEWAERQRRWPDGSNPRSFVFFDPFGSK